MTVPELDRLISKTDLNPASKKALKVVRSAIHSGRAGEAGMNEATWSISVQADGGYPVKMTFSWKKI